MNRFCNNKYFFGVLFVILIASIILRIDAVVFAVEQTKELPSGSKIYSVPNLQPPPTSPNSAPLFIPSTLLHYADSTQQPQTESNTSKPKQEPYRVFFPTDGNGKIVNNIVWLPEEFFRLLHTSTLNTPQLQSTNWNIESAEYIGKLTFNSITQIFEIAEFKAIYQIGVESENVTITLPAIPLAATNATWDSIPIRAVWQINKNNKLTEKNDSKILTFEIENTKYGNHKLEIPLEPPIIRSIDNFRISFDIPAVPNAKLKLITPPNTPTISVTESLGEISFSPLATPNNNANYEHESNNNQNTNQLTANIGQVSKLVLMWNNDHYRNELSDIESDTFIQMQIRVPQVDVRTKFNYKVTGNKIRYVNVLLDNNWQISGQFLCDEHQIDRVETINESIESEGNGVTRHEITRVIFKSPVSGSFTLQAGFVLRDFAGVGHVRLPNIKPYRVKINKSLLAILPDSLLELDLPPQGRNKSISPDWGTISLNAVTDPAVNPEKILAEYNLNQTAADWKLAIKTKSITPNVTLVQSTLLDTDNSTLQCTAEFESEGDMFGQNFTLPQSVIVEAIDVYDSQRNLISTRWGRTQNAKNINNETRIERKIFFRKPLSGKYRITVTGYFVTNNINRVPMIEFNDVELLKHQFELYRASALIVHSNVKETVWKAENIQRNLFANSQFVGLWNSIDTKNPANIISPQIVISPNRPVIQGDITTILFPLHTSQPTSSPTNSRPTPSTVQPTSSSPSVADSTNISVTINNSSSISTSASTSTSTSTSTSPPTPVSVNSNTTWGAIFDLNWKIPAGELEQIRLLLDENIVLITSIEPPVKWSIEQHRTNGQSQLVISPANNTSKQQHFKIHATLNGQNRTISLPKITPEWNNGEQAEIKNYIILPAEIKTEDNRIIGSKNNGDKINIENSKSISWNLLNLQKVDGTAQEYLMTLTPYQSESIYLIATGNNYSASIIRGGTRPFVTLYDINFHVNRNGELFGTATLDLKNIGDDKFIVAMPDGYELIKISICGGAIGNSSVSSGGVKIDNNRWQLEICNSDYPLRIGLIFRAVFDSIPMTLRLPTLENVEVNETLWTISYDENVELAKRHLNVFVAGTESKSGLSTSTSTSTSTNTNSIGNTDRPTNNRNIVTEMLGSQIPVAGGTAAGMLLKFDLIRLDNLLFIASAIPTQTTGRNVEIRHWFTQWEQEWSGINRTINYLKTTYPAIITDTSDKVLPAHISDKNSDQRTINSLIGMMESPEKSLQALQIRKDRESQRLGIIVTEKRVLPSLIESNPVALCRIAMTQSKASLFGTVKGGVSEIRLTTAAEAIGITGGFDIFVRVILIVLMLVVTVLFLWKYKHIKPKEIFLRHPLFWFFSLGCSMLIFFPDGIVSAAILVTVLLTKLINRNQKEKNRPFL